MVRNFLPALVLLSTPAIADEVTGKVLAFDRVASVIVLEDKTVFEVSNADIIPEALVAGETVTIEFQSAGDSGISKINSITKN